MMAPYGKGPRRRNLRKAARGIPAGRHYDRRVRDAKRRAASVRAVMYAALMSGTETEQEA